MSWFENTLRVRFAHVDHAGIVYFAKIFEYCHEALEDLHREVDLPLELFFSEQQIGEPLVDAHARFLRPIRHGELISVQIGFEKIGARSLISRYRVLGPEGEPRALAKIVQVCTDMQTFRSTDIPPHIRAAFERYLLTPEEVALAAWE